MPSIRDLRRRIRDIENVSRVTRAMQTIAASKMRRAQRQVVSARPYSERLRSVLSDLVAQLEGENASLPPLLQRRPVQRTTIVLITPDRGLCGGLISNVLRAADEELHRSEGDIGIIAAGRKGQNYVRSRRLDMQNALSVGDRPELDETIPIAHSIIGAYQSGETDRVVTVFARFESVAVQQPEVRDLLPVEPAPLEPGADVGYIYEPDAVSVLDRLLPRYVEMELHQAFLEAAASEHSARMVAMRNATDNALELVEELTLEMNKARQAMITEELLDIVGGAAAVGA
jgi:F-type H+-transporting ATPase subunit gamma